jgi:ABC-type transport system involved in multi-copper enzyme maturation permease subunit
MTVQAESVGPGRDLQGISGLLRKDWAVFIPRDRFLVALIYLLAHPMVFPAEEAFFWLGIGLAGALVVYVPTMEWHQETDRMLNSLPVRRATVVFSRYLSSVLACIVAGVAWVSTGRILAPLLDALVEGSRATPGMWTTFEGVLTFFLMACLMVSLFLPLYFRFGLGRGAMAFVGLSFGLLVLASFPSGLILPAAALETLVVTLTTRVGPGWVLFLILGGMGAALALSGRLSVRWFERRDL